MAGPQTDSTGQIVKPQNGAGSELIALLQRMGGEISRALPRHMTPDRMGRIVLTALRTTKDLALCTRESFAGCVMQASQLGLEPNTPLGHLYLIPRRNKNLPPNQRECTMVIGYQGFIELARRSGLVSSLYAYAVRQGDEFDYQLGLNPNIHHRPAEDAERENRPITHVYAVAAMRDSTERVFVVLTKPQIEARRARSDAARSNYSPWTTDYEAMALKSAVRALWKWLPKSTEIARAESIDAAAELGASQTQALDPTVTDVLAKHGLLAEDAEIVEDHGPAAGLPEPLTANTPDLDATLHAAAQGTPDPAAAKREAALKEGERRAAEARRG